MKPPYTIQVAPSVVKRWPTLSAKHQKRLLAFFLTLQINPRPPSVEKIEGLTGLYSQQIDHLRVIYKVLEQNVMVLIIK